MLSGHVPIILLEPDEKFRELVMSSIKAFIGLEVVAYPVNTGRPWTSVECLEAIERHAPNIVILSWDEQNGREVLSHFNSRLRPRFVIVAVADVVALKATLSAERLLRKGDQVLLQPMAAFAIEIMNPPYLLPRH